MHNQETAAEDELFVKGTGEFLSLYKKMGIDISSFHPSGKSSLRTCLPKFLSDQLVILVHNVHTSKEDLEFCYADQSALPSLTWCLCPKANLYISGRLPDINLLMTYTDDIVLGTDSLASNDGLSILSEMRTLKNHFPSIGIEQLFTWGTSNGSKALQLDNVLGSFEQGKKPGVVHCNDDLSTIERIL
jgi:cytosine/adenosine deaminase-related metal-dependent hydrolase